MEAVARRKCRAEDLYPECPKAIKLKYLSKPIVDDVHVIFANIASPRTMANLRENPQLTAIIFDCSTGKGCRIWGKAEILDSGDLFDFISAEFASRGMKVKHLVKVTVDEAVTF